MWLFGRSCTSESTDNSLNQVTHAERQRSKQITWLKEELNESLTELERDRHYQTRFTVQETLITLDIRLLDRFPFEGPLVTASPVFIHPWVDNQMVVIGCPLIQQFTPHSNLGSVIKQIINEFKTNIPQFNQMATFPMPTPPPVPPPYKGQGAEAFNPPPPPPSAFSTSFPSYSPYSFSSFPQPVVTSDSSSYHSSPIQRGGLPSSPPLSSPLSPSSRIPSRPAPPPPRPSSSSSYLLPDKLPGICDKSNEVLEQYLSDEDSIIQIDKYISQQDVIKKIQLEMETLFQSNEELAKQNLEKEPLLQTEWAKLQDKLIELQSLRDRYDQLHRQQSHLVGKYDKRQISSQLKTLTQETETSSDMTAEDFLDQKLDSATFLQKYLQERKLYHLRNSKLEMLKYQRL